MIALIALAFGINSFATEHKAAKHPHATGKKVAMVNKKKAAKHAKAKKAAPAEATHDEMDNHDMDHSADDHSEE